MTYELPAHSIQRAAGGVGEYEMSVYEDDGFAASSRLQLFPHAIIDGQTMFDVLSVDKRRWLEGGAELTLGPAYYDVLIERFDGNPRSLRGRP